MEAKFRPVPLSIIDFLGVIVPGFVWLLLLATAVTAFTAGRNVVTPRSAWLEIAQVSNVKPSWFGPVAVVIGSLVVGYVVKPKAMRMASAISSFLYPLHAKLKRHPRKSLMYPYCVIHESEQFYLELIAILDKVLGFHVASLPGNQPFTFAKRLLRLVAPPLWEECEHMEAEVRLTGSLFLASAFSTALSIIEIVRELFRFHGINANVIAWLLISLLLAVLVGDGFNYMRLREVEYTYTHALLAIKAREAHLVTIAERAGMSDTA